jgi:hypothetical protein
MPFACGRHLRTCARFGQGHGLDPAAGRGEMLLSLLSVVIISAASAFPFQSAAHGESSSQYQSGLILEVKEHPGGEIPATEKTPPIKRYDISVQVKDVVYVILFTPRPGMHGFQTHAGMDLLVMVREKTMFFNDIVGRSMSAPIISQHPAAPKRNQ